MADILCEGFSIQKGNGYLEVVFLSNFEHIDHIQFEKTISSSLTSFFIIINCDRLTFIPKDWLKIFLKIHLNLKKYRKSLKLINLSPSLMDYFKKLGVDSTFILAKDLSEALIDIKQSITTSTDSIFIRSFLNATVNTLKVQTNLSVVAGNIYISEPNQIFQGDISGVIRIVSNVYKGSFVLTFPETVYLRVISCMLGEEFTTIDKDIIDGVSELTNMIYGQAKVMLNTNGYHLTTALPLVIFGQENSLSSFFDNPVVVVPFESEFGTFFVELSQPN